MPVFRIIGVTTDEYNFITGADVQFVASLADIQLPLQATERLTLDELRHILKSTGTADGVDYHLYKVAPDLYTLVSHLPAKDGWIGWLDYLDEEGIGDELMKIIPPFDEEYLEVTVLFEGLASHWPGYENDEDDEESEHSLPV